MLSRTFVKFYIHVPDIVNADVWWNVLLCDYWSISTYIIKFDFDLSKVILFGVK